MNIIRYLLGAILVTSLYSSSYEDLVAMSCEGDIWNAFSLMKAHFDAPGALHCLSAYELFLNANASYAVSLHRQAKALNPTLIPPLAQLHLNGKSCGGISDIFYVTAVIIKSLVDSNISHTSLTKGHRTLLTLLSDSGLSSEAETHMKASLTLEQNDTSLRIRSVLMIPGVYKSIDHINEVRRLLESRLNQLLSELPIIAPLKSLDEFSLSPTFYLIYQGYNDISFLTKLNKVYSIIHPSLTKIEINNHSLNILHKNNFQPTHNSSHLEVEVENSNHNTKNIRIGFVSAHFRRHSICKLFCGIIINLNTTIFDIYIFSALQEPHEDDYTRNIMKKTTNFIRIGTTLIQNRMEVLRRNIDVLVYLDVGMDPATSAWAAARLAPIQVCVWGHPSTTGLSSMDYYLSSESYHQHQHHYGHSTISTDSTSNSNIAMSSSYTTSTTTSTTGNSSEYIRDFMRSSDPQTSFSEQLVLLPSLGFYFARPVLRSLSDVTMSTTITSTTISTTTSSSSSTSENNINSDSNNNDETGTDMKGMLWRRNKDFYNLLLHSTSSSSLLLSSSSATASSREIKSIINMKLSGKRIILCLQHLPKFHPIYDNILHKILLSNTKNILILLSPEKKSQWRRTLQRRWDLLLGTHIATTQIIWLHSVTPDEYLTLMAIGDIALDPFPFGGGVTTLEALSVCTPVITLPYLQSVPTLAAGMISLLFDSNNSNTDNNDDNGDFHVNKSNIISSNNTSTTTTTSSSSTSNGSNVSSNWMITSSEAEYVSTVLRLLHNEKDLLALRHYLYDHVDILYNNKESVRGWESFLTNLAI